MHISTIALYPKSRCLRERSKEIPISYVINEKLKNLIDMMFAVLETFPDGVALAAPQVYVSIRLIVIKDPKRIVAINPKIIEFSKEKDLDQEGCLSIPNTYEQVERSTSIVVEYYNERGEKITRSCSGSLARAFQHEVDHLDGVLFIDKIHKNDPSNFVAV